MNIEKYTQRARGFIQSAQSLAMRDGHQQFSPLHMLKVLLDDSEGLAGGLIDRAGGNSRAILKATEDALNKLPKVSGSGAGQVYLAPELARAFDAAEKAAEKAGDRQLPGDNTHSVPLLILVCPSGFLSVSLSNRASAATRPRGG